MENGLSWPRPWGLSNYPSDFHLTIYAFIFSWLHGTLVTSAKNWIRGQQMAALYGICAVMLCQDQHCDI